MMSVRGAGDLLTRISLLLTILTGREKGSASVVDRLKIDAVSPAALQQQKQSEPPAGATVPSAAQGAPAPLQAPAPTVNNPFLNGATPPAPPSK